MSRARGVSTSSVHLEIPGKSTEVEDPGAHDLSSDDEFQDATEGREAREAREGRKKISRPVTPSSPIPITRVEKVDDEPRHGEVPGTPAYDIRTRDAVPDEVEVVPEGSLSKRSSRQFLDTPLTPGGTPIPKTVVEKVDDSTSYGDEPGTSAYRQRSADAIPDVYIQGSNSSRTPSGHHGQIGQARDSSTPSVPETIVTRVDDKPAHGEVPGTEAAEIRKQDAKPDKTEIERDVSVDPDNNDGPKFHDDDDNDVNDDDADDAGFGDDFDDFEQGAQAGADDDFGDFDDFEQEIHDQPQQPLEPSISTPSFPLVDFDALSSLPDLLEATKLHLDAMFPSTTTSASSSNPTTSSDSIPADSPIFPTERSRSLWKQLITPPPLQPPNWTQSRIRRLFLISLGVPVDLDEILPPSKQKKLILPDITLPGRNSLANDESLKPENENISKLKNTNANDSSVSVDSQQSVNATASPPHASKARGRERPKSMKPGPPPPPPLDLNGVKRICATTEEKLEGLTDHELQVHVKELESLTERTSQLLEYWLKRKDGLRKEKEAFDGVIENLVRHAKRVRTIK